MPTIFTRLLSMLFGLGLYALGIAITIAANIGYTPWDALHAGISITTGISFGIASIAVGIASLTIVVASGEKLGLGTLANIVLIGILFDLINAFAIIPTAPNFAVGIAMLIAGMFVISLGSYFYIKASFGAGPRDSLMIVLARRSKLPVGLCRGGIEMAAALTGWFLGGMIGAGTVISFIAIGVCIQIVFSALKFDVAKIRHETLTETFSKLNRRCNMERYAWKAKLLDGKKDEYVRRHDEIWPEMKDILRSAGISNYSIWLTGNELFGYYECEKGVAHAAKTQAESEAVARWNEYMKDVMIMEPDPETGAQPKLEQVFVFNR